MTALAAGRRADHGFTLIEMVVALVVLATALILAATAFRVLSGSAMIGARAIERTEMLARGFDALRQDLNRLERVVIPGNGAPKYDFEGTASRLSFVLTEPSFPTAAGSYRITYTIQRSGVRARLSRQREPYDPGRTRDDGRLPRHDEYDVVLIDGPFDLSFSYFSSSGQEGNWDSSWRQARRLPLLVRLNIGQKDGARTRISPLVAGLRIDAEAGCISTPRQLCSVVSGGLPDTAPAVTPAPAGNGKAGAR
jgi:general secretion pathway protein J